MIVKQSSPLLQLQKKVETFIAARTGGKSVSAALMAHCRRELFHEAWRILLEDDEFLKAYVNGIVLTCSDGITRRVFPRIFTYSADYPEKSVIWSALQILSLTQCLQSLARWYQIQLRVSLSPLSCEEG